MGLVEDLLIENLQTPVLLHERETKMLIFVSNQRNYGAFIRDSVCVILFMKIVTVKANTTTELLPLDESE